MLRSIPPAGELKIAMPDLTSIEEEPELEIAMPELTPAEETPKQPSFVMPELTPAEETPKQPSFVMPELTSAEETPTPPLAAFEPLISVNAPSLIPPALQQPADKSEKLEGNILMYMPHGAEIKRSILKSLLSKRYEPDEIDGKINQLISAGTLSTNTKDGVDYLVRV